MRVSLLSSAYKPDDVLPSKGVESVTTPATHLDSLNGPEIGSGSNVKQHRADLVAAQEFHQIKKFVAARRRQWPGAMIVLRPDGTPHGADAPPIKTQHQEQSHD